MDRLVSIIVNNYNYGRFVDKAVQSALAQTYANIELIIVDDGSTDESRAIIERYSSRARVVLKANGGQASAFNAGLECARGEYVLFLDSDDFLFPDAIEACVRAFPEGYSRVYFRLRLVDGADQPILKGDQIAGYEHVDGDILSLAASGRLLFLGPPTSGNFFAAAGLRSIAPIPEAEFRICADAYVLARSSLLGPVRSLDRELGAYRVHGGNAFFVNATFYSNPQRLDNHVKNFYLSTKLVQEACVEAGRRWHPPQIHQSFGMLHLLVAAYVWRVDSLRPEHRSRLALLGLLCRYWRGREGPLLKDIARVAYLSCVALMPSAVARKVLAWVDYRKFGRG